MSIYTIENGYRRNSHWLRRLIIVAVSALCLFGGYLIYHPQSVKPAANNTKPTPIAAAEQHAKFTTAMPWPNYGQAAYGVSGSGVLAASDNSTRPVPVASLAKIITALAILKQKPLNPGEQGPIITLDDQDVALFGEYIRKDGAVVGVEAGEQISQYQAMQAMLLPSANNMADTLARWAFGSVENYTVYANAMVKELGLTKTSVSDASGFSVSTVSTAPELVQLGELYMKQPVLVEMAMQPEATIPFAGLIKNYNSVINKNGILGIKVGNTDEAGRCFLVAEIRKTTGMPDTVSVTAVVGAPHLDIAMNDAQAILSAGNSGYDLIKKTNP